MQPGYRNISNNNNMANIAAIMGLISIFLVNTMIIPLVCGSLAIILAVLSKGNQTKLSSSGKLGFISALISLIIALSLGVVSTWMMQNDPAFRAEAEKSFQQMTGISLEELYSTYDYNPTQTTETN